MRPKLERASYPASKLELQRRARGKENKPLSIGATVSIKETRKANNYMKLRNSMGWKEKKETL